MSYAWSTASTADVDAQPAFGQHVEQVARRAQLYAKITQSTRSIRDREPVAERVDLRRPAAAALSVSGAAGVFVAEGSRVVERNLGSVLLVPRRFHDDGLDQTNVRGLTGGQGSAVIPT